jgi:hypothetical protein
VKHFSYTKGFKAVTMLCFCLGIVATCVVAYGLLVQLSVSIFSALLSHGFLIFFEPDFKVILSTLILLLTLRTVLTYDAQLEKIKLNINVLLYMRQKFLGTLALLLRNIVHQMDARARLSRPLMALEIEDAR